MLRSIGKRNKITIYLILLLILSTTSEKFPQKNYHYTLKINKIEVTGLSNAKNLEIQNELSNIFYQNLFILGKDKIDKIIKKHNIIDEYNIKKIYPSTLNVNIKPTKFIAKLTDKKKIIVGANGKLIYSAQDHKNLPYIFGEFNSKNFLDFKKNIEASNFNFHNFKTIYFFPSNRWDVVTKGDIQIKLPQTDSFEALNVAYKVISNRQLKDNKIIDLRIKNHLIIK
jgi:cell division protein FtsQ